MFAQQEEGKKEKSQQKRGGAERTDDAESLTGCLTKGTDEGTYVLTAEGGMKTDVTGPAALAKHVGHRVTLTGTKTGDKFQARNIKHLSPTCTP
jgi:hypothetical protein